MHLVGCVDDQGFMVWVLVKGLLVAGGGAAHRVRQQLDIRPRFAAFDACVAAQG